MKLFIAAALLLLSFMAMPAKASWIADRSFNGCLAGQPCNPQSVCQSPNFLYLYDRTGTPLVCFNTAYIIRVGFNLAESCSTEINPDTLQCEEAITCADAKPVSTSEKIESACYNQCAYDSLGGFRDYDNALSPMVYEYVPTGQSCTGAETKDISDTASEYNEINEDELFCRTDSNGYEVCVSDDQTCKLVNGVEVCVDGDTREDLYNCGTFNGEVVCFAKNELSNCAYLNGEKFCTYPDGEKIDPDSADHPANGGNANKDNKDDILDQQDLTDNTPEAETVKQVIKETYIRQQAQQQAEQDSPASKISGIECDKSVSCSGDAIQCAIARMQKKQLCLSEFNQSEVQQLIETNPQMSALGALAGDSLEIDVADFLDTDTYVSSNSQCPEPLSFHVMGVEYDIVMTPLCDLAETISYFIIFATWFSMSIVLAKSLGAS